MIRKDEIKPMVIILMKNHNISSENALKMIKDMNNGSLKELASKVRKRKIEKKKELLGRFTKEFRKMKKSHRKVYKG